MPGRWMRVDTSKLNTKEVLQIKGVTVNLFVSPYDVPDMIGVRMDEDRKVFVIEFKYFFEEPTVARQLGQYVTAHIAKQSSRVHRIEIDVEKSGVNQVQLLIQDRAVRALDQLTQSDAADKGGDNFRMVRDIISHQLARAFADQAVAS